MNGNDTVVEAMAEFVDTLDLEQIPSEVSLRARHLMLDSIGCAMAARHEEFSARFWSVMDAMSGESEGLSGVVGYSRRLTQRDASLMNGVLMHGLDYDDTHIGGIVHLTVSVLPALLSVASQRDITGARFLSAYIAGVECGARLASATHGKLHTQGFHPTGVIGAFASTWALGHLLGLNRKQLIQAQGAVLSMSSGSLQFLEDGAWTKRLHPGWATNAAIMAVRMAQHDIPAPDAPYSGRYGLFYSYLDEQGRKSVDLSLATRGLAGDAHRTWELSEVAIKPFALCHFVHAAADAAIAIHKTGILATQIRSVEVLVPDAAVPIVCEPLERKRLPQTDYDAKFSLPYAVASGLIRGRIGMLELRSDAIMNAEIRALMGRVNYAIDSASSFPRHYSGEVIVTMRDGHQHRHREAINRGHADKPMTNVDVCKKYQQNAMLHFSATSVDKIRTSVLGLDKLQSMRVLEAVLACDP